MRLALYARVSTKRQENEETIETQVLAINDFATKENNVIVKDYRDDGWSGAILARPALDQLRMDAKSKNREWEGIIIYDPDRVARKYSYQSLVLDELQELGIPVFFVTTPPPKTTEDQQLYGVKGLFAEYDRARIIERFRIGKLRKVREGNILLSEAPYGLTYVKKTDKEQGYLRINEIEAENAKLIFSCFVEEKLTLRGLVCKLNDLGIPPRKSKRGVWNTSTLGSILRNETYIGEAHYLRTYATVPEKPLKDEKYKRIKKTSRKLRKREEWIEIPCPRIISDEIFEKAQKQLELNYVNCKRNKKNEYLLAGHIFCPCGRKRTGEGSAASKHLYYRCNDRVMCFPLQRSCFEKGVNAKVADQLLWNHFAKFLSSPELIKKQAERWLTARTQSSEKPDTRYEALQRELQKQKTQQERYVKLYGSGLLEMNQLEEFVRDSKTKINTLESQLGQVANVQAKTDIVMPTLQDVDQYVGKAKKLLDRPTFLQKRAILDESIDKIVATQFELKVIGYLPLEKDVINVEYQPLHRYRRSAKRR